MRILVIMIVIGAGLLFYGYQEMQLGSVAAEEPQKISCQKLFDSGPGDNAHIMLSDFFFCMGAYIHEKKPGKEEFVKVWVPVAPRGGEYHQLIASMVDEKGDFKGKLPAPKNIRLILKTEHVKSDQSLWKLMKEDTIQGLIVNEIKSLEGEELKLLQENYPGIDFSKVWLLEHKRNVSGSGTIYGSLGAGAVLLLVGLGGVIARRRKG